VLQVGAVVGFAEFRDGDFEGGLGEPTLAETDFFEAGDFQALTVLNDGDELAGFEERFRRGQVDPFFYLFLSTSELFARFERDSLTPKLTFDDYNSLF
jgi:hypothetical protein